MNKNPNSDTVAQALASILRAIPQVGQVHIQSFKDEDRPNEMIAQGAQANQEWHAQVMAEPEGRAEYDRLHKEREG